MNAEVGPLDLDFGELTTTAHIQIMSMPAAVQATQKYHLLWRHLSRRHLNYKPGKSFTLLLPALSRPLSMKNL